MPRIHEMTDEEWAEYQVSEERKQDLLNDSPVAYDGMTDDEIKQSVYDRYNDPNYDDDHDYSMNY